MNPYGFATDLFRDRAKVSMVREINYLALPRHLREQLKRFSRSIVIKRLQDIVGKKRQRLSVLNKFTVAGDSQRQIGVLTASFSFTPNFVAKLRA